jgi:hypothetical protein
VVGLVTSGLRPGIPISRVSFEAAAAQGGAEGVGSLVVSDGVPLPVAHIIEACWAQDPAQRPSFIRVVEELEEAARQLGVQMEDHGQTMRSCDEIRPKKDDEVRP